MATETVQTVNSKKTSAVGGLILLAIAVFYAAVCTPVSLWSSSDVLIKETGFPQIWDLVQSLVQFLFWWISLAFFTVLALNGGMKEILRFLWWNIAAVIGMNIGSMLVGTAILGSLFEWDTFADDLLYALLEVLLALLLIGLAILFIWLLLLRKKAKIRCEYIPFRKVFDLCNRLQVTLLILAAIPSAVRLISRVIYDAFYGAPQNTADLLWMIFFYFADLLSVFAGYLFLFLLISRMESAKEKEVDETLPGDHI